MFLILPPKVWLLLTTETAAMKYTTSDISVENVRSELFNKQGCALIHVNVFFLPRIVDDLCVSHAEKTQPALTFDSGFHETYSLRIGLVQISRNQPPGRVDLKAWNKRHHPVWNTDPVSREIEVGLQKTGGLVMHGLHGL